MNVRTKALAISKEVKLKVAERDGGICICCNKGGLPEAHYISRAKGGLGIEQNIVTLCRECHGKYDNSTERRKIGHLIKTYLGFWYPGFKDEDRIYKKWSEV